MATASQSLYNMSVATDNAGSNQAYLMPKLAFRYRVNFINFGVDSTGGLQLTKHMIECGRPTVQFPDITLHVYNSTMYLAGKPNWSAISMNIRDDSTGTVSKALGQQIQKQQDFVEQASAAVGHDYKFQCNLEVLDGGNGAFEPVVLEAWEMYGCFLNSVNYNSMNYGTNDAMSINVSMRFDNAIQAPLGSGIGTNVGRAYQGSTGIATGIGSFT